MEIKVEKEIRYKRDNFRGYSSSSEVSQSIQYLKDGKWIKIFPEEWDYEQSHSHYNELSDTNSALSTYTSKIQIPEDVRFYIVTTYYTRWAKHKLFDRKRGITINLDEEEKMKDKIVRWLKEGICPNCGKKTQKLIRFLSMGPCYFSRFGCPHCEKILLKNMKKVEEIKAGD
ncbi:hypothetical protein J7K25_00795 [bacterium]|nr:hypothetical protein [bacterium]